MALKGGPVLTSTNTLAMTAKEEFSQKSFAPSAFLQVGANYKLAGLEEFCQIGNSGAFYIGIKIEGQDKCPGLKSQCSKGYIGKAVTFKDGRMITTSDQMVFRNEGSFVEEFMEWCKSHPMASNHDVVLEWGPRLKGKWLRIEPGQVYLNQYNKVKMTLNLSLVDSEAKCKVDLTKDQQTAMQYAGL